METATFLSSAKEKTSRKQARTGKHRQTLLSRVFYWNDQATWSAKAGACVMRDLMQGISTNFPVTCSLQRRKLQYGDPPSRERLEGFSKLLKIRQWRYVYTSRDRLISYGTNASG